MRLFGRNDEGSTGREVVWQECPGCQGGGYAIELKTNKKGQTVEVDVKCSGCRGIGKVPGETR